MNTAMHRDLSNSLLNAVLSELDATSGQVFARELLPYSDFTIGWSLIRLRRFLLAELGIREVDFATSVFSTLGHGGVFGDTYDLPADSVTLDRDELAELLVSSGTLVKRWPRLHQRFPKARGVLHVAAPRVNESQTSALMYVGQTLAPLMGRGRVWSLEKREEWAISRCTAVWFS